MYNVFSISSPNLQLSPNKHVVFIAFYPKSLTPLFFYFIIIYPTLQIAVTAAFPYIKPKLVSRFHDRDDLIRAVMTSCHIPYWLDNRPVTEFRGTMHLDGGLTNFIPG